jgi:hypothetical protein
MLKILILILDLIQILIQFHRSITFIDGSLMR